MYLRVYVIYSIFHSFSSLFARLFAGFGSLHFGCLLAFCMIILFRYVLCFVFWFSVVLSGFFLGLCGTKIYSILQMIYAAFRLPFGRFHPLIFLYTFFVYQKHTNIGNARAYARYNESIFVSFWSIFAHYRLPVRLFATLFAFIQRIN